MITLRRILIRIGTMITFREFLSEKSVSKAQQRLMGMAHAVKKYGDKPASDTIAKLAKNMKSKDLRDFAKTKHKGLPDKK